MTIAPLRGAAVGRPVPLAPVMVEVDHALAAVEHGRGGYIWTGPPGAGKSTLLDLVVDAVAETDGSCAVVRLQPALTRSVPVTEPAGTSAGAGTERLVAQLVRRTGVPVPGHLARALVRPSTGERPDAACAALVEYTNAVLPGSTLVLVVDDLDALDAASRSLLLYLVTHHQVSVVLLASATHAAWAVHLPYPLTLRKVPALGPEDVLHLLAARQLPATAPHVAATLSRALSGITACILQTAAELTGAQLAGTSLLPNPLPAVPALEAVHGATLARLGADDRRTLLVAAVSVVDRTDLLLTAADRTLDDVLGGPVADLVHLAGGRFTVADPALRALVHGTASVAERTAAHLALAAAHRQAGLEETSTWHTALGSLAGDTSLAPALIDVAERLLESGDVVHAHEVAREAASQSTGTDTTRAQLTAGIAALRSGHVLDADDWLQQVVRSPDAALTGRALGPYLTAVTLHTGRVPDDDLALHAGRALEDGDERRETLVAALSTAARLHAERGHLDAATACLRAARETCAGGPSDAASRSARDRVELDAAWCAFYGADVGPLCPPALLAPGTHPDLQASARACRALLHVLDGDVETARSSLASAMVVHAPVHDDGTWRSASGTAVSPLAEALLRSVQVLVELAAGELDAASDELARAAFRVPVGLPLGGVAVAAARRLDVFRTSADSELALALGAAAPAPLPSAVRREALVDAVLRAERTGSDEVAMPELELLAGAGPAPWSSLLPGLAHEDPPTRTLGTASFHRARQELVRARAALQEGGGPLAHEHLVAAADLFGACGADAWRDAALRESDAAATPLPLRASPDVARDLADHVPLDPAGPDDPPQRWTETLTRRELDVALLVVQGASNRDVATRLHLSVRTVEVHLGRVFRKLGARSRVELTVLAHRGARRTTARSS